MLVDAGFAVHLPEERRYGLGVTAFEVGSAYTHQDALARLARPLLARLVDAIGQSAHLAVLHGREVLYVVEERATGRPSLVTDVGVRLPAQLAASGRAMLAALPAAQVRALFPDRGAFVLRHAAGPDSPSALRRLLVDVRARGYATEDGEITPGFRERRHRRARPRRPPGGRPGDHLRGRRRGRRRRGWPRPLARGAREHVAAHRRANPARLTERDARHTGVAAASYRPVE